PSRDRTTAFRPRIIGPRRPGPSAVPGRQGRGWGGFAGVAARGVGYTTGSGSHKSSRTATRAGRASGADPGGRVNSPEPDAPTRRNRDVADYTYADIARMFDHAVLQPVLTDAEMEANCRMAREYGVASVCIKPYGVPLAARILAGSPVKVCTVIGFPH